MRTAITGTQLSPECLGLGEIQCPAISPNGFFSLPASSHSLSCVWVVGLMLLIRQARLGYKCPLTQWRRLPFRQKPMADIVWGFLIRHKSRSIFWIRSLPSQGVR
jgi:hypothetical protein